MEIDMTSTIAKITAEYDAIGHLIDRLSLPGLIGKLSAFADAEADRNLNAGDTHNHGKWDNVARLLDEAFKLAVSR
jgi:hypothetical protein